MERTETKLSVIDLLKYVINIDTEYTHLIVNSLAGSDNALFYQLHTAYFAINEVVVFVLKLVLLMVVLVLLLL